MAILFRMPNDEPVLIPLFCLVAFLVGGIPFGYLAGRALLKDDIRKHGSGNIGATNVGRVIGWKWGGLVLVLDALKGMLPTWLAMKVASEQLPESLRLHAAVATGICAIIGHMYPVYLKLRGGKGVATALGVVLVLAPKAVGVAFVVFLAVTGLTRKVALASMAAAVTFGIVQLWLMGTTATEPQFSSMTAFSVLVPLLIIWRHRSNIMRMLSGTEPPVTKSAAPDSARRDSDDTN
ncbi:MAG: glycerol-3-phosphate 1-O-acyltransferase PlsY [Planctomycetaceae bacterium]